MFRDGGLAEFERELIRIRTGEGRARAKANGQSLGRKPKLTPHQQHEAIQDQLAGPLALVAHHHRLCFHAAGLPRPSRRRIAPTVETGIPTAGNAMKPGKPSFPHLQDYFRGRWTSRDDRPRGDRSSGFCWLCGAIG